MIPVFLGSEILSEYKSEDGAVHTIERKCKLDVDAPYLLKKVLTFEMFCQSDIYSKKDSIFVELVFNTRLRSVCVLIVLNTSLISLQISLIFILKSGL